MSAAYTNVQIYGSPFRHESRILKQTLSLENTGEFSEIIIVAINDGQPEYENISKCRTVWRSKLISLRLGPHKFAKICKIIEWSTRVLWWSRKKNISHVSCHSFSVLPLCVLLKKLNGAKLIYETHELETEVSGLSGIIKRVAKWVERFCMPYVDITSVVSPSIADWYRATYKGCQPLVVRNVPNHSIITTEKSYFRNKLGLNDSDTIFLYLGLISHGRFMLPLVETFSKVSNHKHLVILGYGPLSDAVKAASLSAKNIHILEAVPPEEVLKVTAQADVGLSMIENICLSYYYCLPNKLFEFAFAGIPIIGSDCKDMAAFITQYDCGWVSPCDVEQLHILINTLTAEEIAHKAANTARVRQEISWDTEMAALCKRYI